jgi:hypothetical protein
MPGLGILILKTEAAFSFGTSLLPKDNCIVGSSLLHCCEMSGTKYSLTASHPRRVNNS